MSEPRLSASDSIRVFVGEIVRAATARQESRQLDPAASLSALQSLHIARDLQFHAEFLAATLWTGEQVLFDDYVLWTRNLLENRGRPVEGLWDALRDVGDAAAVHLAPPEADAVTSTIEKAIDRAASDPLTDSGPHIDAATALGTTAEKFLEYSLRGNRIHALDTVEQAVQDGTPIEDVYLRILQPVLYEVGRLWQLNRITVAQEHYATAVVLMTMSRLFNLIVGHGDTQRKVLVAAAVGEDLHDVGIRMVADLFEIAGWKTHCYGASTPSSSVVEAAAEYHADLVALSATMMTQVPKVFEAIESLRNDERTKAIPVLVGGRPFNLAPELWHRVRADGYAESASAARRVAEDLIRGG